MQLGYCPSWKAKVSSAWTQKIPAKGAVKVTITSRVVIWLEEGRKKFFFCLTIDTESDETRFLCWLRPSQLHQNVARQVSVRKVSVSEQRTQDLATDLYDWEDLAFRIHLAHRFIRDVIWPFNKTPAKVKARNLANRQTQRLITLPVQNSSNSQFTPTRYALRIVPSVGTLRLRWSCMQLHRPFASG